MRSDEFNALCDSAEAAIAHAKKAEADGDVASYYFWKRIAFVRVAAAASYIFDSDDVGVKP